ncbi:RCC1 domain-containing protein, partial [Kaarinaea lacus]
AHSLDTVSTPSAIDTDTTSLQLIDIEFGKTYYIAVATVDTITSIESPLSAISEVTMFKRPQYALGQRHTCAINSNQQIYCTGANEFGQLGNNQSGVDVGKTVFSSITNPGQQQWQMVVAGEHYNCAIDGDQQLYCWGDNRDRNLATGSIEDVVVTPTRVSSNLGWLWVTARNTHLCGIKTDHSLWCWGNNDKGQLGTDTSAVNTQEQPVKVGNWNDWLSVSVGESHTCGIRQGHSLWCWGANDLGQIGDPSISMSSAIPIQLHPNDQWMMVSSGQFFSCAIKVDGTAWCWGNNIDGQLGNLTIDPSPTPIPVATSQRWQWISAGAAFICAIDTEQGLWCWGDNWGGQIGKENFYDAVQPTQVGTSREYAVVATGDYHSCALKQDQSMWCWGHNLYGQLGNGSNLNATHEFFTIPQQSGSMVSDWISIDVGYDHVCGIRNSGTLWCWGSNYSAQLATGDWMEASQPRLVENYFNWVQISISSDNGCAIDSVGDLYCWGLSSTGAVGQGSFYDGSTVYPTYIQSDITWLNVSNGVTHTCGLKADNTAWCWGSNNYGQLGDGFISDLNGSQDRASPYPVNTTMLWKSLTSGGWHNCGIAMDDRIYCWGWNAAGQLGVGDETERLVPTLISDNSTWKKVRANWSHTCAIKSDDSLWCWGYNTSGQLGNGEFGDTAQQNTPVPIASGTSFKDVSLGAWHTCAITINNEKLCWGYNSDGQLATGNFDAHHLPHSVLQDFNPIDIQLGADVSCLLNDDSSVWCWGANFYGQIGNGTAWSLFPEIVQLPE